MKIATLCLCNAILSRSLFSTSTFADVDLRQSPSCLTFLHGGRRLSVLTQIYNAAVRLCLLWRGQSRSSNPHQVNHHPSVWRGSELLTLCVCVCLLNVWLAGSGVGVVRTLEATSWRTTSDPTHLPRCTLALSLRSDGDSCFALKTLQQSLKVFGHPMKF